MVLPLVRRFNSIKVQLEHSQKLAIKQLIQFQFHKGAIRTFLDITDPVCSHRFNSIKVQLELVTFKITTNCKSRRFNSIKVQLEPGERYPDQLFAE